MAKKSNHVVPRSDGWAVKKSGSVRSIKNFDTQREAIEYGTQLSRKEGSELYIHKQNGQIREKNSFGNDANPSKTRK